MLEATKLAILAKEKFSRVQELYKVFLIIKILQCVVADSSPISGAGQPVASWELLEVLPAVGLDHLLGFLPCLPHSLLGDRSPGH